MKEDFEIDRQIEQIEMDMQYEKDFAEVVNNDLRQKMKKKTITQDEIDALYFLAFALRSLAYMHQPALFSEELMSNLKKGILPDEETVNKMNDYVEFVQEMECIDDRMMMSI